MNSPFAWPGGKRNLKKTLLSLIPEHDVYVEVFAGSAKLLLAELRGDFLMSFDDCAEVRTLARRHGFHVRRVEVRYALDSTAASRSHKAAEVLISKERLRLAA